MKADGSGAGIWTMSRGFRGSGLGSLGLDICYFPVLHKVFFFLCLQVFLVLKTISLSLGSFIFCRAAFVVSASERKIPELLDSCHFLHLFIIQHFMCVYCSPPSIMVPHSKWKRPI